jgi:RimJ/RimL family protein N-acetyltransferase
MLKLRPLELYDLPFLLEIRNDESTRKFLGNNSIIYLSDSIHWFNETHPQWFIIEFDNKSVGYIRTSDDVYPSICIGCDIHPDFRNKGYAKLAYQNVFDFYKRKNYNMFWLEVFEDNIIARRLYEKLGFQYVDERIIRNKKYLKMEWIVK